MSFIWPPMLLALLLVPVGVGMYVALARRRTRRVAAYGGLGRPAVASGGRRRSITARAFVLAGLTLTVVALARPQTVVSLPSLEGTVILAFDVSGSMAATDFSPTRMEAAKAAARSFVQRQPTGIQVGVVAFSDSGVSVQAATSDQAAVIAAIERLGPQRGTSLAQGIVASLDAIAKAEDPTKGFYTNRSPQPSAAPIPPGSHASAVIVLLTDGENNEAPDPIAAAQVAADRGIRIHTVGIGSRGGTTLEINGFRVHTQLDPETLRQIADTTDGTYNDAADQAQLDAIYDNLQPELTIKTQEIEVTSIVAGMALVVLLIGALVSVLWLGRMP